MTAQKHIEEYERQCSNLGPEGEAIIKELADASLLDDLPESDKQEIARLLTELDIAEAVANGRQDLESTLFNWRESNRPGEARLKHLALRMRFKQEVDDMKNRELLELSPELATRRQEDLAEWGAALSNLDLSLISKR